jgi:DTW domain-containing protein YfiP
VVPVRTRTRILVVRHALEAFKSTNTGRIALLGLENAELVEHGGPEGEVDLEAAIGEDAALLFPDGRPLTRLPRTLVVLDASWAQARRMTQRIAAVRSLPRLTLPPFPPLPRLRRAPREDGLSTIEAIARAVAVLEGEEAARPIERLCELHVERALASRGR